MAHTSAPPTVYSPATCIAEVWPDPEDWRSRQEVRDVNSLVRLCGPRTLDVIRNASYSLAGGSDLTGAYTVISEEFATCRFPAGFVSACPGDRRVTIGLPGEPTVSIDPAFLNRDLSCEILAAEVMCA